VSSAFNVLETVYIVAYLTTFLFVSKSM